MKIQKTIIFADGNDKNSVQVSLNTAKSIQRVMQAKDCDLLSHVLTGLFQDIPWSPGRKAMIWTIVTSIMEGKVVVS